MKFFQNLFLHLKEKLLTEADVVEDDKIVDVGVGVGVEDDEEDVMVLIIT